MGKRLCRTKDVTGDGGRGNHKGPNLKTSWWFAHRIVEVSAPTASTVIGFQQLRV
jgi:hypothetical protein